MIWGARAAIGLATALCLALAPPALAACKVGLDAIPVTMAGPRALISAKINGQPVRFLADSGAFYSMLSPAVATELKLSRAPAPYGLTIEGIGGSVAPDIATVRRLTIKDTDVPNLQFLVGGGESGQDVAGMLGQNFWHIADVEYDLPEGVIRLAHPSGCGDRSLAYWAKTDPVAVLDMADDASMRGVMTRGRARVNGKGISVLFDTGAAYSVMTFAAARRIGIDPLGPETRDVGKETGVGRHLVPARTTPIDSFDIGGETIKHTRLLLIDSSLPDSDMLLGADFFLSHRIYVANGQRKIYFTYNGGPVFALGAPEAPAGGAPPEKADAADASETARRGEAAFARQEYAAAIADLTRAHELEPKAPQYLYERARAYAFSHDPAAALADLDAALTLAPDDVEAHVLRAEMRLAAKDRAGAETDVDAASKLLPDQADTRFQLGELYLRLDDFKAAIREAELWIKVHPDDAKLPMALNMRCWAGGLSGADLPMALKACDAAVRRDPRNATFLDSRGLVHLRLSLADKAVADYDAALARNPKLAWSLYGRGLAEAKLGETAKAKADLDAAAALAPKLADRARTLGVGP